jgi:hypothetical protein
MNNLEEAGMSENELTQKVRAVQEARQDYTWAKAVVDERRAEWERENAEILEALSLHRAMVDYTEAQLRDAALAAYQETGERRPVPGVEVKVYQKLSYDESDALGWAKLHGIAVTLDKRAFEKIAKAQQIPGIVEYSEEPKATIAQDLSRVVLEEMKGARDD